VNEDTCKKFLENKLFEASPQIALFLYSRSFDPFDKTQDRFGGNDKLFWLSKNFLTTAKNLNL